MNLYIMRHSITVWNEKRIIQGHSNNRLSKNGKELANEVAKKFKDVKFDVVYCSPLMRTMQTANIMNQYHNVNVVKNQLLIEIDQGIFTGRRKNSLTEEEKLLTASRSQQCGMESFKNVYERCKKFLTFLQENNHFKNVLVVTHNACASLLECAIENFDVDFTDSNYYLRFKNAEVKKFSL